MTQLRVELNRLVKRYLDDQVDADALDRWVLERLQAILDSGDARAITLANAVDGGLVQFQEGAITKAELQEELQALVAGLTFQFDEEIPLRLADLCRTMAERYTSRPAFRQASFESLLEFLGSECGRLLTDHPADFTVVTGEATSGACYGLRFTILYDHLSCELAASAFDRFVLGRHVQAPVVT